MGGLAAGLLRDAVEALDDADEERAVKSAKADARLDAEYKVALRNIHATLVSDTDLIEVAADLVIVIKALERGRPSRIPMVRAKWWGEGLREQYGARLNALERYPGDTAMIWVDPLDVGVVYLLLGKDAVRLLVLVLGNGEQHGGHRGELGEDSLEELGGPLRRAAEAHRDGVLLPRAGGQ